MTFQQVFHFSLLFFQNRATFNVFFIREGTDMSVYLTSPGLIHPIFI